MSEKILKQIKDEDIEYVDLRFTDPRGKLQHVTFHRDMVDEDFFEDGSMFDGSSIAGWKAINESDMTLMPDPSTAAIDPFYQQTTMSILCDILEPSSGEAYNRDPRTTCAGAPKATTPATCSIPRKARIIPAQRSKAAIWATGPGPRAAISR
jgi:glutamine synthetase